METHRRFFEELKKSTPNRVEITSYEVLPEGCRYPESHFTLEGIRFYIFEDTDDNEIYIQRIGYINLPRIDWKQTVKMVVESIRKAYGNSTTQKSSD